MTPIKLQQKASFSLEKNIVRTASIYTRKPAIKIFTLEAVKKKPFSPSSFTYIPGFKFSKILKIISLLAIPYNTPLSIA
jgi:hypothetical protein